MTDIVERLRSGAEHKTLVTTGLVNQAADEIERLREALREIADRRDYQIPTPQDIARAALKEKSDE